MTRMIQPLSFCQNMSFINYPQEEKFRNTGIWNKGCKWCKWKFIAHKWSRHWGGFTCTCPSPAKPATSTKLWDTNKSHKAGVWFPPHCDNIFLWIPIIWLTQSWSQTSWKLQQSPTTLANSCITMGLDVAFYQQMSMHPSYASNGKKSGMWTTDHSTKTLVWNY